MKLLKRIVIALLLLLVIGGIILLGIGYFNYQQKTNAVSIEDKVSDIRKEKTYVRSEEISENLLKATIAIEDRRFEEHNGVDYISMARAFVSNLYSNGIVGGGSTITQQLAKNMYFTYQPSYIRKVSEVFVAYDLEKQLGKQDILELYVNIINYGDNHMGIYEASKGYFKKEPKDLTLDEATLLAGLPQSPSNFQLSNHMKEARIRQKAVLEAMVRDEYITKEEMTAIVNP